MMVPLRTDLETRVLEIKPKVYPLGYDARKLVDDTFDKLQAQSRLVYTTSHTPFSVPVFVVWKTSPLGEHESRAVVNVMVVPDLYFLPLQSEIIANVQGYTNLAVLDAASFFYQ